MLHPNYVPTLRFTFAFAVTYTRVYAVTFTLVALRLICRCRYRLIYGYACRCCDFPVGSAFDTRGLHVVPFVVRAHAYVIAFTRLLVAGLFWLLITLIYAVRFRLRLFWFVTHVCGLRLRSVCARFPSCCVAFSRFDCLRLFTFALRFTTLIQLIYYYIDVLVGFV